MIFVYLNKYVMMKGENMSFINWLASLFTSRIAGGGGGGAF